MEKEIKAIRVVIENSYNKGDKIEEIRPEGGKIFLNIDGNNNLAITRDGFTVAYYPKGFWFRLYIEY